MGFKPSINNLDFNDLDKKGMIFFKKKNCRKEYSKLSTFFLFLSKKNQRKQNWTVASLKSVQMTKV